MSWLSSIGHVVGGVAKKAAPFAAMIPAVGPLAGGLLGAAGGALEEGGGLKHALQGGLEGGAGGLIGKIPGLQGMLGKVGGVLGNSVKDTFMPGGKLDLGKVIGAGSAVSGIIGQNKQRGQAEKYNNAMIDQRNKLMQQIMQPPNYNLPQITPAQSPAQPGAQY